MSPIEARRFPAKLIVSGPAGGPVAGKLTLAAMGRPPDGIVVDMGGTSFDVSVICQPRSYRRSAGGQSPPRRRTHAGYSHAGCRRRQHCLARSYRSAQGRTAQCGFGTRSGLLRARRYRTNGYRCQPCPWIPRPHCRSRRLPAVGPERASNIIRTRIAEPLGLTVQEAASGIHRVATANMIVGVREMTVERGIDPRRLPLILAGGAAGLHGVEIAEGLGIIEVIAPRHAGVYCALGMALTGVRYDYNATLVQSLSDVEPAAMRSLLDGAYNRLRDAFADLEQDIAQLDFELEVEARYVGQFHELAVPVGERDLLNPQNGCVLETFHQAHSDTYGFAQTGNSVEIVNLRVTGIGVLEGQTAPAEQGGQVWFAPAGPRRIWSNGAGNWLLAQSYVLAAKGHSILRGVRGPSLVDLPTSTLLVPPGWVCSVTDVGDLLLVHDPREEPPPTQ